MQIREIKEKMWIKQWSGNWNILNDTLLGYQYTKLLKEEFGVDLKYSMFIYKKGISTAYFEKDRYHALGHNLADIIAKNKEDVDTWCQNLKIETDNILNYIKKYKGKKITMEIYQDFINRFYKYAIPHRAVKVVVDFLEIDKLKELLPKLSEARVYAEPVYKETEEFIIELSKIISKKSNYKLESILTMDKDEINEYFRNNSLPDEKILAERYQSSLIYFKQGEHKIFTGEIVSELENIIGKAYKQKNVIKGTTAYEGKVEGKVRIVLEPDKTKDFNNGDILITGMTRPEYLHLIKKSGAFITDAGGMLSHAAITARELKKPCVVGTEVATKVFKDGDMVEVDATKGIIKKL